ncbi:MAG TPA: recombinase family protein [Spirochaetia bacterium]|nr:recombinase family protein [Spirochaetia bacterium]
MDIRRRCCSPAFRIPAHCTVLRSYARRNDFEIARASIAALLKNPFYSGDFLWNRKRYQGKRPPIVDKELSDRVQTVIAERNDTRAAGHRFATSGLLKCSQCGCSITAEISTRSIERHEKADEHCIEQGIRLLELARTA